MPVGTMTAPPGLASPAVFPFPAAGQGGLPPPGTVPYFVGNAFPGTTLAALPIAVRNPTNPGDVIMVVCNNNNGQANPASCADTQGNTYSLTALMPTAVSKPGAIFAAQNTTPLGTSDTVTVTYAAGGGVPQAVVIGVPLTALASPAVPGPWLTYDMTIASGNFGPDTFASAPYTANYPSLAITGISCGDITLPQVPPDWTVLPGQIKQTGRNRIIVCYKQYPSITKNQGVFQLLTSGSAGAQWILVTTLIPETRFAPRRIPEMPPGNLSPAAWQFPPSRPGGAVTNTIFLNASVTTAGSVSRGIGQTVTGTATTAGGFSSSYVYGRVFSATVTTAGSITRSIGKTLAGLISTVATFSGFAQPPPGTRPVVTIAPLNETTVTIAPANPAVVAITPAGPLAAVVTISGPDGQEGTYQPARPVVMPPTGSAAVHLAGRG